MFGKIEKEEEQKKQEAIERRSQNAPAPGAKPSRKKKTATEAGADGSGKEIAEPSDGVSVDETGDGTVGTKPTAQGGATTQGPAKSAAQNGATNRTPKPGARPKKRKR